MFARRSHTFLASAFYVLATLEIVSFYVMSTRRYLNSHAYLTGRERLPFQERIFPALFLSPMLRFHPLLAAFAHLGGVFMPVERGASFIVSLISFAIAGYFTIELYKAVSPHRSLPFLVFPAFLYISIWSYVVLVQMNFSYPYDFPSLAFFTAGIYYVYRRRFIPLLLVVFIGTFNRETTLFLIGLYILDSATKDAVGEEASIWRRSSLTRVSWIRVTVLSVAWCVVRIAMHHRYAGNDSSESYLRVSENLRLLTPKHWPALLNICGYLLPIVFFFRSKLVPSRFANYTLILPVWIIMMFCAGVLVETRIYGELSGFTAVAVVLLVENYVHLRLTQRT